MIKLLADRILIKLLEEETVSAGGLFLVKPEAEPSRKAKVVGIGPGKTLKNGTLLPFEVKIGDTVLVSAGSGTEARIAGETHIVLTENDILAILD